jgi:hypothetical protein
MQRGKFSTPRKVEEPAESRKISQKSKNQQKVEKSAKKSVKSRKSAEKQRNNRQKIFRVFLQVVTRT